ncbi:hypothetical protein CLM85_01800, partial [Streptomyces albidoflavus]|uniref:hypothetical protein n=1 Tax=Streptomyces albidoflavus TaxID=1886 RepID=UPI000BC7FC93
RALLTALARLHTAGVAVDWTAWFTGPGARRTDLPTYAFQREPSWPDPAPAPPTATPPAPADAASGAAPARPALGRAHRHALRPARPTGVAGLRHAGARTGSAHGARAGEFCRLCIFA